MAKATRTNVKLDLRPLRRFERAFRTGMAGQAGPIDDFYKQAGTRILAMNDRRYSTLSRGGSFQGENWEPLAPSTLRGKRRKRRRRTARGPRKVATLIDTGTTKNALTRGAPGNVMRRVRNGIELGIGGGGTHPAGPTIGQIAAWHHRGAGRLPQRRVVTANLDAATRRGIQSDADRALRRLLQTMR